ncbi:MULTISPECIES: alanine racemase [Terrisporobacter]|uniref:Alanine racemase n=1 Tax=Terrisporobacter muris TaxID=2963284 RepID=A0A9X2MBQ3_9FIRM|nr:MULTISPECIES: alanine racemase [Terrisporobacter]MCC3669661.1 alanine racemase [Terrisporobacter mayombei]MCR1822897.1 alanine racemase [Terrisporobacter muris]MDU6985124.1 alanine racemase [Terrisporobacter othiniensis]
MINSSTWAEINLQNIKYNVNSVKKALNKGTNLCCVVKANAYGHGAVEVSKFLEKENVDFFSVARLEEALELVKNNIKTPILCMGYIDNCKIHYAIDNNIRITVYSLEMAQNINDLAKKINKKAYIHIKLDTGMSRIGFLVNDYSIKDIKNIFSLENIIVEGIYTHFAKADEDNKEATFKQISKYQKVIKALESANLNIPIKHVSNSAAILDLRDCDFNMVRLGVSLYGCYPSDDVSRKIDLKTCLELKSKISNIKTIEKGTSVSYAGTYTVDKDTKIATIPVGYADGFPRTQKNPKAFVNGRLVNIVGRICMDQTMLEIPNDLTVNMEDEVILIGDIDGIKIGNISGNVDTIDHEVLCNINRRVNRVYLTNEDKYTVNYVLD